MRMSGLKRVNVLNAFQKRFISTPCSYHSGFSTFFSERNDPYKKDMVLNTLYLSKNKSDLFSCYGWKRDYQFIVDLLLIGQNINMKHIYTTITDESISLPNIRGLEMSDENEFHNEWMGFEQEKMNCVLSTNEFDDKYYLKYVTVFETF